MTQSDPQLTLRAELCLCLSRAFLPPLQECDFVAMTTDFPADLEELDAELSRIGSDRLMRIKESLASLADHSALLRTYSRLFLAPPAPALLNLGFYLDGGLMGNSCSELERLYIAHGLQRDPQFRDGSDHLALYLQFLAWCYAQAQEHLDAGNEAQALDVLRDVGSSLVRHGIPAIGNLIAQLHKAESSLGLPDAFGELAELTRLALTDDARAIGVRLPAEPVPTAELATPSPETGDVMATTDTILACSHCGQSFLAESALATMVAVLRSKGLDTAHLSVCHDCRTQAMGLTPMEPPRFKKAS